MTEEGRVMMTTTVGGRASEKGEERGPGYIEALEFFASNVPTQASLSAAVDGGAAEGRWAGRNGGYDVLAVRHRLRHYA